MIAAGVVLSIVVGYLAQPLAARGARWLWHGARTIAGTGVEITWQVAETIGKWSVEAVELLNPWRRCAEVEHKLAEARLDLDEVVMELRSARMKLTYEIRHNEDIRRMLIEEAEKVAKYAASMKRVP